MTPRSRWAEWLLATVCARLGASAPVRQLARNAVWLMLDRVVRSALTLAMGAWIARALGPSQFGEYSYAITVVALFLGIANLGLDGLVVRDLARTPNSSPETLGTVTFLRLAAGMICWPLAVLTVYVLRPQDHQAALLVALVGISLLLQSTDTVDLWLQSQSQNRRAVTAKLCAYLCGNLLRIGMIAMDAPLWAFALCMGLDTALSASALTLAYRTFPAPQSWRVNWAAGQRLLKQSWPFMLSGVSVLIYMRIDQIMIREMLGEEQLGIYSSAVLVSQLWHFLPVTLCAAMAPAIARKRQLNHPSYMRALGAVFQLYALGSIVLCLVMVLLAEPIINMLYGQAYLPAVPVVLVHIWSNIFVFLGVAQGLWLVNEGFGRMSLYRTVVGAASAVVGNWMLIPSMGLQGAALSTVLAMFISAVGSNALLAPHIFRMQLRAFIPIPVRARRP